MNKTLDHIVYLDYKAREMESLLSGNKTMIIRGATGRKLPHGKVNEGNVLYFINNNGEGLIKAKATVCQVFNSDKMTEEESKTLVKNNQNKLQLTEKQFEKRAGKRYIVLIEVKNIEEIEYFSIDRSNYGNMDDWLLVGNIESIKK